MSNDNTMGAPTEGLGQTVTFAARSGGGVPQTTASNRQSLRMENRGGGAQRTAQALQVPPAQPDATVQALFKLGGEMLRPHVEAERQAKYVEGMQKAAQGQAITEIVEEQPWYSKIFGSTSLVDGARAYTATAKATSVAVDLESNMEELKRLSPNEFSKHTADIMKNATTGDSATDMMISQQLGQTLPAVMKGQAKAHIRYKQEKFDEGMDATFTANFALLGAVDSEARKPNATKDSGDTLEQELSVLKAMTPPPEIDRAHFNKVLAKSAVKAIMQGNFAVANLLDNSKVIDSFSPEEQIAIRAATNKARVDAKLRLPLEFSEKLEGWMTLSGEEGTDRKGIIKGAEDINAEYTKLTGDSAPYLTAEHTARNLAALTREQRQQLATSIRERDKASTTIAKAEAQQAVVVGIAGMLESGTAYVGDNKKADLQDAWAYVKATASPEKFAKMLVQNSDYNINEAYKDTLRAGVTASMMGQGNSNLLYRVYTEQYLPLIKASGDGGEAVARQYAGDKGEILSTYHRLAQGRPLDQTTQDVFYADVARPQPKTAKNQADIVKEITNSLPMRAVKGIFMRDDFQPVDPTGLANELATSMDPKLDTADAIKLALKNDATLSVAGGYHWRRNPEATDVKAYFRKDTTHAVPIDEENRAFRFTADKIAHEAGIDGSARIEQITDNAGIPRFYAIGVGSDGNVKVGIFTGATVSSQWAAAKETSMTKPENWHWGDAPAQIPEGQPSIYASPEAWAAYRKKQAADKLK